MAIKRLTNEEVINELREKLKSLENKLIEQNVRIRTHEGRITKHYNIISRLRSGYIKHLEDKHGVKVK